MTSEKLQELKELHRILGSHVGRDTPGPTPEERVLIDKWAGIDKFGMLLDEVDGLRTVVGLTRQVLSYTRFHGTDDNPMGIRDVVGGALT